MSTIKQRHVTYSIYHYLPIHWQDDYEALRIACLGEKIEVAKLLLDRGANIEAKTNVSYLTM